MCSPGSTAICNRLTRGFSSTITDYLLIQIELNDAFKAPFLSLDIKVNRRDIFQGRIDNTLDLSRIHYLYVFFTFVAKIQFVFFLFLNCEVAERIIILIVAEWTVYPLNMPFVPSET